MQCFSHVLRTAPHYPGYLGGSSLWVFLVDLEDSGFSGCLSHAESSFFKNANVSSDISGGGVEQVRNFACREAFLGKFVHPLSSAEVVFEGVFQTELFSCSGDCVGATLEYPSDFSARKVAEPDEEFFFLVGESGGGLPELSFPSVNRIEADAKFFLEVCDFGVGVCTQCCLEEL